MPTGKGKTKADTTTKPPAKGKGAAKTTPPATMKVDSTVATPRKKSAPASAPEAPVTAKPKGKAPVAAPAQPADPAKVAAQVASMLGAGEGGLPALELLGVLHGEPMTGATVAERYETRPVNPIDPLRKHKLVVGDKARRFAPTPKGREVWSWAVEQAGA